MQLIKCTVFNQALDVIDIQSEQCHHVWSLIYDSIVIPCCFNGKTNGTRDDVYRLMIVVTLRFRLKNAIMKKRLRILNHYLLSSFSHLAVFGLKWKLFLPLFLRNRETKLLSTQSETFYVNCNWKHDRQKFFKRYLN